MIVPTVSLIQKPQHFVFKVSNYTQILCHAIQKFFVLLVVAMFVSSTGVR